MPIHWTSAILKKLQARYGHKWTAAIDGIEGEVVSEWSRGLAGLTGDQIKIGLDGWDSEWPPSMPEFRAACLGKKLGLNDFGLTYVPEYYRQTKTPERDPAKLLSNDDREKRRAEAKAKMAEIKARLHGKA